MNYYQESGTLSEISSDDDREKMILDTNFDKP